MRLTLFGTCVALAVVTPTGVSAQEPEAVAPATIKARATEGARAAPALTPRAAAPGKEVAAPATATTKELAPAGKAATGGAAAACCDDDDDGAVAGAVLAPSAATTKELAPAGKAVTGGAAAACCDDDDDGAVAGAGVISEGDPDDDEIKAEPGLVGAPGQAPLPGQGQLPAEGQPGAPGEMPVRPR